VYDWRGCGSDLSPPVVVSDELREVLISRSLQCHHQVDVRLRHRLFLHAQVG
jgi:hypothetical protein